LGFNDKGTKRTREREKVLMASHSKSAKEKTGGLEKRGTLRIRNNITGIKKMETGIETNGTVGGGPTNSWLLGIEGSWGGGPKGDTLVSRAT